MSSSAGRRSAAYVAARERFKRGDLPCWLRLSPDCTGIGTTVDHYPPLNKFPHPDLWRGEYRPACPACQSLQGNQIRQGIGKPSRAW